MLSYNTDKYDGYSPFAYNTTLKTARLGNPVTEIQPYLFANCTAFTTLNYNDNCKPKTVGNYAFWGCTSLTEADIVLPQSIQTIGEAAFRYCTSLKGFTIPDHVTEVKANAFLNCERLANVVIKPSVKTIGNFAFNGCTSLTQLTIEESENALTLGYGEHNSSGLGKGLFRNCPLQSVFIGRMLSYNTDKYDGYSPFAYNDSLKTARLGNKVTTIPNYLFARCTALTSNPNLIPSEVKQIGVASFQGCKLTSVTIPAKVTSMGNYAFADCLKLTNVTSLAVTPPTINKNCFSDETYQKATLNVIQSSTNAYSKAEGWKEFHNMTGSAVGGITGDVNHDGIVDVTDVSIAIDIVLGRQSSETYEGRADLNGDGQVDVSDVSDLIDIVLGK